MSVSVSHGDCLDILPGLPAETFHAVVTDPPYHLGEVPHVRSGGFGGERSTERKTARAGFMGKAWDGGDIAFRPETWVEVMRVMKPGAHLVAFGGSRTFHRIACAIEDAGFEYRDTLMWLYGSGFPKSRDAERGIDCSLCVLPGRHYQENLPTKDRRPDDHVCPSCVEGDAWQGWGTALKPAFEPIILARKPLVGSVARNVLAHGCGGLNIEPCRVETTESTARVQRGTSKAWEGGAFSGEHATGSDVGRWPANVLHDGSDEVLEAFAAFGEKNGGHHPKARGQGNISTSGHAGQVGLVERHADTGSASRFFYCAKADRDDRAGSKHPTVKPVALMRWLCRLVTPPGGHLLDLFAGSGTTGEAARLEGFDVTLIEQDATYIADINRRLGRSGGADTPLFAEASP